VTPSRNVPKINKNVGQTQIQRQLLAKIERYRYRETLDNRAGNGKQKEIKRKLLKKWQLS